MNDVTVVRIYVTEGGGRHEAIFKRLHDVEKMRGVTMFRGIAGFGVSGEVHGASLLDMSLDLPVVVEFFDTPERVEAVLRSMADLLPAGHVLTFAARIR
ncbi:MAG: DUF190 domain-containing protein [Ectothiorhodospiraceae bacterium]|jgi:PII-like signaling protein|nr:DUF190 domain-containing protein [Ectothiorhodospiraceae bacterium]